jgi:hypothetical protein
VLRVLAFVFGWRGNGGVIMPRDLKIDLEKCLKELWFTTDPRDMFPATNIQVYLYAEILERAIAAENELKLIHEVAAEQASMIDRFKRTITHIATGKDNIRKLAERMAKLEVVAKVAQELFTSEFADKLKISMPYTYAIYKHALAELEGDPPCPK